jgi:hypothetical protein
MRQRGGIPLALIILLVVGVLIVGGLVASCDALFTDPDEENDLGMPALVLDHDGWDEGDCDWRGDCGGQEYDQNYGSRDDRNRNRNRDRGAFSPGPFRDSPVTICAPYSCNSGGEQSGGNRENPQEEERS